jgi:hypothetical protein
VLDSTQPDPLEVPRIKRSLSSYIKNNCIRITGLAKSKNLLCLAPLMESTRAADPANPTNNPANPAYEYLRPRRPVLTQTNYEIKDFKLISTKHPFSRPERTTPTSQRPP